MSDASREHVVDLGVVRSGVWLAAAHHSKSIAMTSSVMLACMQACITGSPPSVTEVRRSQMACIIHASRRVCWREIRCR